MTRPRATPSEAAPLSAWRRRGTVVVIACVVTWLGYRAFNFLTLPGNEVSRAKLERWAHVRLPAGLRRVDAYVEGWQDPSLRARFEMTPGQLEEFLVSTAA